MKKNPEISIIVPMYNVQKFIKRCLHSIENQTFTDYEVLMINDGSPDKSAEIAATFAEKDDRFILFNKENGGLSDTRNYGIERARGKYLAFIDSDDYIRRDYLEILYHECVDNDADMSYCRFEYSYFNTGLHLAMPLSAKKEVMKTRDALNLLIRDNYLHSYAWNKLYKKTLFTEHNITYPDMYFEDLATSARLLRHANRIAVNDQYLYFYEKRFGSIMATMNAKKIDHYLLSILIIRNYLQNEGIYDDYEHSVKSIAHKAHLLNMYSIVRQHLLHLDFRNMKKNFDINRDLYAYIISPDYQPVEGFPELPIHFIQPGHRQNKKKKK